MGKLSDASSEYQKNKELKKQDIELLKEWMDKQPHLPKISEFQLILFLHSCFYRIEPTKICIESFYTCKTHAPEFFKNQNPRKYESELFDTFLITGLPKPSKLGYQIVFMKFLTSETERFDLAWVIKSFDMSAQFMLHQKGTASGHLILADMKGLTFAHLTKFAPTHIMKFFFYLQEGLPFRLKGLYLFNVPSYMDKFMGLIKPFMKKELLESLQLHTDKLDDLYKLVPLECFPKDYGGEAPSVSQLLEQRKQNFFANEEFFVQKENEIANESRRIGKPKYPQDIYGMEGTFKKLEID